MNWNFTFLLCLTLFVSIVNCSAQSFYTSKNGDQHLLGTIERKQLEEKPYQDWFKRVYDRYTVDKSSIKKLNEHYSESISIKVYLGTWCGDSKREVSRFMKIIDESKMNKTPIELICLDQRSEHYKQGPNNEEKGLNIHRVPTFIFYKNEEEIGRIVEFPTSTLEKDLAQIYAGIAPVPNYRVANYVLKLFQENTLPQTDTFLIKNAPFLKRKVKNEVELNTLGYVLLAADEIEKAIIVFKLNTLFFPDSGNVFDSLGEAYLESGEVQLAVENYTKSLQLDPQNENAVRMIQEIARK